MKILKIERIEEEPPKAPPPRGWESTSTPTEPTPPFCPQCRLEASLLGIEWWEMWTMDLCIDCKLLLSDKEYDPTQDWDDYD